MENMIIFMLKSSISMIALYSVYLIFLKNETFFSLNRFYLLGTLIMSLLIPLIKIPIYDIAAFNKTFTFSLNDIIISNNNMNNNQLDTFNLINVALISYVSISGFLFIRLIIRLIQIYFIYKKGIIQKLENTNIVRTNYDILPFSFYKTIFINPQKLSDDDNNKIITHELVHVKELHTIDMILVEIINILMWFNPAVWLIKSSLRATHEYIADRNVILKTENKIEYQKLLLKEAFGGYQFDFTNNFNLSLIKRRITMMTKNVSTRTARLKVLFVLPVAVILLFAFAFTGGYSPSIAGETKKESKANVKKDDFVKVDVMPAFDQKELAKAIKFPEEARKAGKSGKVICKVLVSKEGLPAKIEIEKSDGKVFENAVIEAIQKIKFTPAKLKGEAVEVNVYIPIKFKLK